MSNGTIFVDCIVDPATLKLSSADFEARIVEPMIARLRHSWKSWDSTVTKTHLKFSATPIDQNLWDALYSEDEG